MIYVDTSAVVAALDPTDPRMDRAREALGSYKDKIVSELVIAELASVLARQRRMLAFIRDRLGVGDHLAFTAVILYILRRFGLKYIEVKEFTTTPLGRFCEPIRYTVELAGKLRLKTLDLLHLAYIKAMEEQGVWIHTLLTAVTDFKNSEEDIRKALGITVDLIKS
jgi:predicted nucleic acid-binding protein